MLEGHISRSLNYFYITYVYRLLKMDRYVYMKLIAVTAVTAVLQHAQKKSKNGGGSTADVLGKIVSLSIFWM
jgi:hypothetical protein